MPSDAELIVERPSVEYVGQRLHYEPSTGVFTWKRYDPRGNNWNAKWAGRMAGKSCKNGQRRITIDKKTYEASHIAWALMTGNWPSAPTVDHANRIPFDNRWENLREATLNQQKANQRVRKDSKSGIRGVCYIKDCRKWAAYFRQDGKQTYLGVFPTIEEAAAVRRAAVVAAWGEFSNG
jgi:hypothetical protein